jgi:hypothetical protein
MWEKFFLIVTWFATNVQLKDLTHMFCPWIPSHKLYKQGAFFCVLSVHIKIHVPIWDELKKLTLKTKYKIK